MKRKPPFRDYIGMTHERAHQIAREKGVSRPLYALARVLLTPFFRVWLRLRATGVDNVPEHRGAIIAPNHKSGWDPFLIAACLGRPMRFMAKAELFEGILARPLLRLGAFPVRRGQSDADAVETARRILDARGLLVLFPEGKVVRDPDCLGMPRRGVGRIALETGSCVVPTAITGSGMSFARPGRVRVDFSKGIMVHEVVSTPEAAGELVERTLWPQVTRGFRRLRAA